MVSERRAKSADATGTFGVSVSNPPLSLATSICTETGVESVTLDSRSGVMGRAALPLSEVPLMVTINCCATSESPPRWTENEPPTTLTAVYWAYQTRVPLIKRPNRIISGELVAEVIGDPYSSTR
jgi:hypothetical protein